MTCSPTPVPADTDDDAGQAPSPAVHPLDELALYGCRPFQDDADPRPLPEPHAAEGAVAGALNALADLFCGTRLEDDLPDLLWSFVKTAGGAERRIVPAPAPDQPLANPAVPALNPCPLLAGLGTLPTDARVRPRFISSSTWEPRARLHGGFPMVAGAARKPRAELFSPPLGSSRPLRCKKARPFGSLATLGPGRVQASPGPPITERHRNGAQPQRWREP